jgi:hypothetical protein
METNICTNCEYHYPKILHNHVSNKRPFKLLEGDQHQCDEFDEEIFKNLSDILTTRSKEESLKVEESVYYDAQSCIMLKTEDNNNLIKMESLTNTQLIKEEEMNLVPERQHKITTDGSSLIRFPENCNIQCNQLDSTDDADLKFIIDIYNDDLKDGWNPVTVEKDISVYSKKVKTLNIIFKLVSS